MILPEFGVAINRNHYACWGADNLMDALPKTCPACGARLKTRRLALKYHCGAEYKHKPQGQTHTAVFWGTCPKRADVQDCEEAGLALDTPPGIIADKLEEMGRAERAAYIRTQCGI